MADAAFVEVYQTEDDATVKAMFQQFGDRVEDVPENFILVAICKLAAGTLVGRLVTQPSAVGSTPLAVRA